MTTRAQLKRRSRAGSGLADRRKLERGPKRSTKHVYALRGRVRCVYCGRRMEGTPRQSRIYYRCAARTLVPNSPLLEHHPKNVYLPEAAVLGELNTWLDRWLDPEYRDETVAAFADAQPARTASETERETLRQRVSEAETQLKRLQDAIRAGVDPAAVVSTINQVQANYEAAKAELSNLPAETEKLDIGEIHAALDNLADQRPVFARKNPAKLAKLYEKIGLEMTYDPDSRTVEGSVGLGRRDSDCVRGGRWPLSLPVPQAV